MSNKTTRTKNKNIANKGKIKKAVIKIVIFIIFLWILNLTINAAASTKTITIVNPVSAGVQTDNRNAPDASQDDAPDPCGLEVVQCDGEGEKTPQNANLSVSDGIEQVEKEIRATFHENPDLAVAMARCESGLIETKVGDGHLAFEHDGELLGRSIGIFMVRTGGREGGKIWNRAAANGKTVAEFEKWMMDASENIKYARTIYERSGNSWTPWLNCARKNNAL